MRALVVEMSQPVRLICFDWAPNRGRWKGSDTSEYSHPEATFPPPEIPAMVAIPAAIKAPGADFKGEVGAADFRRRDLHRCRLLGRQRRPGPELALLASATETVD